MNQFIDTNELLLTLTLAVQGVFVLFFIVSPIGGALLAKGVAKKTDLVLILAATVLAFNLTFGVVTYWLQTRVGTLADQLAALLGLLAGVPVAALANHIARMFFGDQPVDELQEEMKGLDDADYVPESSFEEARRERLRKKRERLR